MTHLEHVVTHLEYYNMLHSKVFLHEGHTMSAFAILEGIVVVAVESIHDISFEVPQEIDLGLQIFRKFGDCVVLPNVDRSLASR